MPVFNSFSFPWRIEGKATPFAPRVIIAYCRTLEAALRDCPKLRKQKRFYSTVIRPN